MAETPTDRPQSHNPAAASPVADARRRSAWPLAAAAVALALVGVGAYLAYDAIHTPDRTVNTAADRLEGMAGKVYERVRDGLRPQVTLRTTVFSQFAKLDATPKLVVLTDTITIEVVKSSEKRVLWGLLNLGTTEVRLRAPGNKVQFYVPLKELAADDFRYDAAGKRLVVRVPPPVLDRDIVEVQSDPAKIEVETQVGWGRLSAFSGKYLEEKAREAMRAEVIASADTQPMRELARVQAEKALRAFFGELAAAMREGVRLEFEFKEK